jgi:starch-binding outer membrane protein, SusD/RagB family
MVALLGVLVAACDDILTVADPQRYTSEDLDQALDAVASGVEGDMHWAIDQLVIHAELNSDVYRHTGTWAGYEDFDRGTFNYGNSGGSNTPLARLLQARWAAIDAKERFERVMDNATASPLYVQVQVVEGITDLLLGQNWCEAPLEPMGAAVPDTQILESAVQKLTTGQSLAQAAGQAEWARVAQAARARAHLLLGNYGQAAQDAAAIPDGFMYAAKFSTNSGRQNNSIVSLTTAGENRAAGIREIWWDMVDTDAHLLRDPWTDELDPRVPIRFVGELGVNGFTDHYSQWKYRDRGFDIPMFHTGEMRLIQAEAAWRDGDLASATDLMNGVRAAAGLSALPATTDPAVVRDYLIHERFAQMFMEGQRMSDLGRFGLFTEIDIFRGELPNTNIFGPNRPVKFPLSRAEAVNNPEIADDAGVRCLPRAGG